MLKTNKLILIVYMIVTVCFSTLVGTYIIAASNGVVVTGPAAVEEGQTITFNINFSDNVQNIWLSDGDIIKKGFSGTVNVNKVTDRNYTVVISNVSGVGANKYIVVNSGVGYIDGKPLDAATSSVFEIKQKAVVDDGQNNNQEPQQPQPQPDNNQNNNNNQETQQPDKNQNNNQETQKPSDNINNNNQQTQKPNNNTNANVNNNNANTNVNNTQNNVQNETSNAEDIQINTEEVVEEQKVLREIPNTGKIM